MRLLLVIWGADGNADEKSVERQREAGEQRTGEGIAGDKGGDEGELAALLAVDLDSMLPPVGDPVFIHTPAAVQPQLRQTITRDILAVR